MIDAHVHVWRIGAHGCTWPPPSLAAIHRDIGLDELRALPGTEALRGAVLVQSQEDPADTRWLLSLAATDDLVAGVVGWTDLADPQAPATIVDLAQDPKLRGLRPMVQDRAPDWYDRPELDVAWTAMAEAGLVLDALVRPAHLPSLERLARRHPSLLIVIDHAAKPALADTGAWQDAMRAVAGCANVAYKLSGLLTELRPSQPLDLVERAVATLSELFGPDRLVWGSDWPVLTLAGDYAGWLALARAGIPAAHHDAVFGGNARRLYGLPA